LMAGVRLPGRVRFVSVRPGPRNIRGSEVMGKQLAMGK
jgi:hypothetical protein